MQWLLTETPSQLDPAENLETAASGKTNLCTFDTEISPLKQLLL
jgi:hypothetical protein